MTKIPEALGPPYVSPRLLNHPHPTPHLPAPQCLVCPTILLFGYWYDLVRTQTDISLPPLLFFTGDLLLSFSPPLLSPHIAPPIPLIFSVH